MTGRVAHKVAIVMGGGQTPGETIGNGRATAMLLAREGAHVVVADRRLDSAQDTVDMITGEGGRAFACEVDVTIEDSVKADEIFNILMGDAVEPRRAFIQRHALEVKNLDV